jgi:hypothetical protein
MNIQLNKWEEIFADFLDMIDFSLLKDKDEDGNEGYRLIDLQGANLGDIQSEIYNNAEGVLDRMEIYEDDYIINDIAELLDDNKIQYNKDDFDYWPRLLKYRDKLPDYDYDFELLDMICNHGKDIDINKVYYKYYSK